MAAVHSRVCVCVSHIWLGELFLVVTVLIIYNIAAAEILSWGALLSWWWNSLQNLFLCVLTRIPNGCSHYHFFIVLVTFTFWFFLNCAFRHELPMNSDASRSHVLIFITKPTLRITKVKMCCGPHAVSATSELCHTSHEILTFFFCDPRIRKGSAHQFTYRNRFFSKFENRLWRRCRSKFWRNRAVAAAPLTFFFLILYHFNEMCL